MNVSVIIPAFNCEATIRITLESALRQTAPPYEILAMDDGSTDATPSILKEYKGRVVTFRQPNAGVGSALSGLCRRVRGDVVAVLGSDDVWHPRYLEIQQKLIQEHPGAVAYFTGHVNFTGGPEYEWRSDPLDAPATLRLIPPRDFLCEYNKAPGPFACMSHCCVPARALREIGQEPFKLRMAEDLYFFNRLAPLGPVLYASIPLVAYRIRAGSLSADRLLLAESEVRAFELLEEHYRRITDRKVSRVFHQAFAVKRRLYSKFLMGEHHESQARRQLACSLSASCSPASLVKSIGLLLPTCLPTQLQPTWPASRRDLRVGANC